MGQITRLRDIERDTPIFWSCSGVCIISCGINPEYRQMFYFFMHLDKQSHNSLLKYVTSRISPALVRRSFYKPSAILHMFGSARSFKLGADVISYGCSCSSFKRSVDRYETPASATIRKQAFSVFALCYTRWPVFYPSSSERVSHHQLSLKLLINCRTALQCDTWDSANIYANAFDLFCVFLSVTKSVFHHRLLGTQQHHRFLVETAQLLRHKRMENVFKVIYKLWRVRPASK
jgi:hypothetical protein